MTKSYKFKYLCLIIILFSVSAYAQNETAVIKNMSQRADVIISGKVIEKESNWNSSKTRIYTKTTVQVEEYLKGNNNEKVVEITSLGGEVGDVGELYTHMPKFDDNEELVVFLKIDSQRNEYKVMNGEEGKITVLEDEITKEKVTRSNIRLKELKSQIKNYSNEQE